MSSLGCSGRTFSTKEKKIELRSERMRKGVMMKTGISAR
jgi:hypothetical protein